MLIMLSAWCCLIVLMVGVWLYYRITHIPNVVDVAWSIGHWLAGTLYLFAEGINTRKLVLWVILTVWALRLAGYLYWTRLRLKIVDQRYIAMQDEKKMSANLSFFLNYQLQACLIMLTVSSLYLSGQAISPSLTIFDWIAIPVILSGIIMTTLADLQLRRFVQEYKGRVCNRGLWQYSRHPNYFFEWLVWVGFALSALATPYGFLSILSPLTLYLIMTKITGPITERGSLESKPAAYQEYQKTTSMFFPWPSRKK